MQLSPEVSNIARVLKGAGYTSASIGKWHLGPAPCWPEKQGFDLNVAGCHRGQPPSYFSPYKIETLTEGPKGEFLSDRLTTEALQFIEQNKDRPFFLYLPHYAVHTPLQARPEVVSKYKAKADPKAAHHNSVYAGLVESVDDSVGRLLDKLDELKLSENTIVVFTSDNGGLIGSTSNAPLRAGKGSAYEGGVRVPLIVKWPGVAQAGAVCDTPVISADFYPTILAITGASAPASHAVDGESITPLLKQSGPLNRDALYWHYPHYHPGGATPYSAVRQGDFRLVEFHDDGHVELFDLKTDLGETRDLAAELPEKAAALRKKLHAWRREVGARCRPPIQTPTPRRTRPKRDGEAPRGESTSRNALAPTTSPKRRRVNSLASTMVIGPRCGWHASSAVRASIENAFSRDLESELGIA